MNNTLGKSFNLLVNFVANEKSDIFTSSKSKKRSRAGALFAIFSSTRMCSMSSLSCLTILKIFHLENHDPFGPLFIHTGRHPRWRLWVRGPYPWGCFWGRWFFQGKPWSRRRDRPWGWPRSRIQPRPQAEPPWRHPRWSDPWSEWPDNCRKINAFTKNSKSTWIQNWWNLHAVNFLPWVGFVAEGRAQEGEQTNNRTDSHSAW